MTITGISCPHCKSFYWLNSNECCPSCGKPRYEDRRSTLYPEVYFSVFGAHTTEHLTGRPVRVRSSREQNRMCEETGSSPYRDYKETFKKGEEHQKKVRADAKKYLQEAGFGTQGLYRS